MGKIIHGCLYPFFIVCILFSFGCTKNTNLEVSPAKPFDWRSKAGTTIHLLANDHPWITLLRDELPAFESLSGISVQIDAYPEDQFRTKRKVEMLSGISRFDVYMIMPGNSLSEYRLQNWVEPLDPYLSNESMACPDFDKEDFFPVGLKAGSREGFQFSIPILLETSILAYNKELFKKYRLKVPETMEELEDTARKLVTLSNGKIYGITLRGNRAAATSQWSDFLHSFGGNWLTAEGNFALDSDASIASLEFYGRLLRKYGPPDATRNSWYESVTLFMQGKAGMIFDSNVFRSHYEHPDHSRIHQGGVGYVMIPRGPTGHIPHVSNWGLAIYPRSKHKKAAWLFIQWATGKEVSLAAHLRGIPSARKSVWKNQIILEQNPAPEWTDASVKSYQIASIEWNPPVIQVEEARKIIGDVIVAAILGEDVKEAAVRANNNLNVIIKLNR